MALMFITFLFTTALYGALVWLAWRRVVVHLKENPEGVQAFTQHILIPLLGRRPEQKKEAELEPPIPRNLGKRP